MHLVNPFVPNGVTMFARVAASDKSLAVRLCVVVDDFIFLLVLFFGTDFPLGSCSLSSLIEGVERVRRLASTAACGTSGKRVFTGTRHV